jgi:4a-hydroxytetrahydrobiopterin dehydratase
MVSGIPGVRASVKRSFQVYIGRDNPAMFPKAQTSGPVACTIGRMTKKLSEAEIRAALQDLSGWTVLNGKLHREYKFTDFIHAFGFMASGAIAAEAMGHHPEWLNVYNRLNVDLTTHDAGGISAKDIELAGKLDALYPKAAVGAEG